ncbi:MAG: metallophosphoesterase [Dinoroseobacter sp.]|nr:metallophosphoesterase [Dinoroseobacter sp.]
MGPSPDRLTYAIGDIHGRLDLLDTMVSLIEADRAGQPADLVFLGDYIDRGLGSAQVLRRLQTLELPSASIHCLMGNHERMFLDFLDDPVKAGPRWLHNGGLETLESFLGPRQIATSDESFETICRDKLLDTVDSSLLEWVRALALQWRSGDLGCVHAITDPRAAWDAQKDATLLWGRPKPKMPKRADGMWIAHGHTVVEAANVQNRRIALDTGAYLTGVLSAARFENGSISLLTTTPEDRY